MRVVLLSEVFGEGMGYLENLLPKYFARLGVETHVVATDLPLSYRQNGTENVYQGFEKRRLAGSKQDIDGYTLHTIGHKQAFGHIRMAGLRRKLVELRPDIVQTMTPIGWLGLDAALLRPLLNYQLFTGSHHHASVLPLTKKNGSWVSREHLRSLAVRKAHGRFISWMTKKCYAITQDCAEVAERLFGVQQKKIAICPLGVDPEIFHPAANESEAADRIQLRQELDFPEREIVCIYSGRFSEDKNPLLLAKAIEQLWRSGLPYRGLFVGNGVQAKRIAACAGCRALPFVAVSELARFYRVSDIGVWPTQESMSMLDAAACGIPIVANHTMVAKERLDGNGLAYHLNDLNDLVHVLLQLRASEKRTAMGECGARKMATQFSWEIIARQRIHEYERALGAPRLLAETSIPQ
jgi:glycosyltransferase involved in cell wall biosynthesis